MDELLREPELEHTEGSEIQATVDTGATDMDGVCRPVLVNQNDTDFLALTVEDAKRLLEFLNEAIPYLEGHVRRITQ